MVVRYHFRKLRSTSDFGVPPERSSFARSLAAELQSFKTSQEFKRRRGGQHEISRKNSDADGDSGIGSCGDATLGGGMTRVAVIDVGIALILFGGIISIVLYAMAATRRERALRVSPVSAPYTTVSAATAQ